MSGNVQVQLRRGETSERLVRRVVEIYLERTQHHIKSSVKKKLKRQKAMRERQKLEKKKHKKMFR